MIVSDSLRVGDTEREQAVRILQRHYQQGRLTANELEERVQKAYAAKVRQDLAALLRDLPEEQAPERVRLEDAGTDAHRRRWRSYAMASAGMVGVWAMSGHGYFWQAWPMFGWGLAMVFGGRGRGRADRCGRRRRRFRQMAGGSAEEVVRVPG